MQTQELILSHDVSKSWMGYVDVDSLNLICKKQVRLIYDTIFRANIQKKKMQVALDKHFLCVIIALYRLSSVFFTIILNKLKIQQ